MIPQGRQCGAAGSGCAGALPAGLEAQLRALRHELHKRPELGFQEYGTAERVAAFMVSLGLEVETGVGGTGVVGLLRGSRNGLTVGIRACLDALPV